MAVYKRIKLPRGLFFPSSSSSVAIFYVDIIHIVRQTLLSALAIIIRVENPPHPHGVYLERFYRFPKYPIVSIRVFLFEWSRVVYLTRFVLFFNEISHLSFDWATYYLLKLSRKGNFIFTKRFVYEIKLILETAWLSPAGCFLFSTGRCGLFGGKSDNRSCGAYTHRINISTCINIEGGLFGFNYCTLGRIRRNLSNHFP